MLVTSKHHNEDVEFLMTIDEIQLASMKALTKIVDRLITEVADMREELDFLIDELDTDD